MSKHQKHAKLAKPNIGQFNRNEISILGTPCGNIKKLSYALVKILSSDFKVAYVDADHKSADTDEFDPNTSISYGTSMEYVDKINFHRFDTHEALNEYTQQSHFSDQDLVIVNGNHFPASSQIAVIDPKKPLDKKLTKLTNVELVLFAEEELSIPDYLREHIVGINSLPCFHISETEAIARFLSNRTRDHKPVIKGLVLAGGRSLRMERDKGTIDYHGKDQRMHMYGLLNELTSEAYLSVRPDQLYEVGENVNSVIDTFMGLGPYGAILSAFRQDPNAAWLVTACDQPFLDKSTLEKLIEARNPSKMATAFYNPETDFPEPLITLWEPRAYLKLLYFLSMGYSCPRKVLINTDIEMVRLEDPQPLKNVNTPEELANALEYLKSARV